MKEEQVQFEGNIHSHYRIKSLLKVIITEAIVILPFALVSFYIYSDFIIYGIDGIILSFYIFFNVVIIILSIISCIVLVIMYLYFTHMINTFKFQLKESHLTIDFGSLRKTRMIIPYSQIQNISITCGLLDKLFKLSTIRIETSGASGYPYKFGSGPEGYIPGIKEDDCTTFEKIIIKMIREHE